MDQQLLFIDRIIWFSEKCIRLLEIGIAIRTARSRGDRIHARCRYRVPLTVGADVVGEEEVELPDGDVDVVRVDTEAGVQTVRRLLQPLPVCALQGNSFEENHLDQV